MQIMNNPNKALVISHTFVVCLLLQMKTVEKHHGKSLTRESAIRHTLLGAEGLISRVNLKKVSIQYEFMMVVISTVKKLVGKNKNKMT
jgi:hypothetical protein